MYLLLIPGHPRVLNPDSWRSELQGIVESFSAGSPGTSVQVLDESGTVICSRTLSVESSRGCPYAYC